MKYSDLSPEQKASKNAAEYQKRREWQRAYYAENREMILTKSKVRLRKRYREDPEKYREMQRIYYWKNREQCLEKSKTYDRKKWRTSTEDRRKKQFLTSAKSRAKDKGVPFSITVADFTLPTHCPLLGLELDYSMPKGYHRNHPSLDRVVPALGYVPGNVWIISRQANVMKNDATLEMLQTFTDNLRKQGLIK